MMNAISYTVGSAAIVESYDSLPVDKKQSAYWSADEVTPIRAEIKDYYITQQGYQCAYCNTLVPTNNNALWDAEHVISRNSAPQFMFEPRNLAISCRDCNIAKGEKEIRRNPGRKAFPDQGAQYVIVHPHFDTYSEHIRWFGPICASKSKKGSRTIEVCNLTRFTAEILGMDGKIVDPDFDALVGKVIQAKTRMEALTAIAGLKVHAEAIDQE